VKRPDHPWQQVAELTFPVTLRKTRSAALDQLLDLPEHSALSLARIDPKTACLTGSDWRGSGEHGFYPASSIKLITAAMTLGFLDEHQLPIDAVVRLGDEDPMTFRELLAETIVLSGNETFNILQETVGFAETYQQTQRWGLAKTLVRRHFKNPRYNYSRPVTILGFDGKAVLEIPARPTAIIPLHDGNHQANQNLESNWTCTDDLVRIMAAVLFGPTRHTRYFPSLTGWCGMTNCCHVRTGLRRLTAANVDHPPFVILNKPGWWPADRVNVDFGYVYDLAHDAHYIYAVYCHGTEESAAEAIPAAFQRIFGALHSADSEQAYPFLG
jgi:hypothetical protein